MPTSVLLAVLAAAGLLALAPALTRRHDSTERLAAERATSTARVLSRRRRRRTVPGPRPINPPRFVALYRGGSGYSGGSGVGAGTAVRHASGLRDGSGERDASAAVSGRRGSARRGSARRRTPAKRARQNRRPITAMQRRRRVFLALLLLNLVELAGVVLVGPGFWIGFAVTFALLLADMAYLRHRAVVTDRLRQAQVRRARWVAKQQAAVRLAQEHRALERQAAARRAAAEREEARKEAARRAAQHTETYGSSRATGTEALPRQRSGPAEPGPDVAPRAGLRGRAY